MLINDKVTHSKDIFINLVVNKGSDSLKEPELLYRVIQKMGSKSLYQS